MPIFDKPLQELETYKPPLTREDDFDAFWERTLAESRQAPLNADAQPANYPVLGPKVYDVLYDGWRGARINGWFVVPHGEGPFPTIIQYHGYSGNKGEIAPLLIWAAQGYAVFAVDVRGQSGRSTDPTPYSEGHIKGWMTAGITDPEEYYYRGVYVDCVRAIDFVCSRPECDARRIGLTGISQGGALSLAVAGLDPRPVLTMPEVPYLCHFQRAVEMAAVMPYLEISDYIRVWPKRAAQVWRTLSYFDNLNLAPRIRCATLVDVGLLDDCCPPSTIYAVYNQIRAPKEIVAYPYHKHEQIGPFWEYKLTWAHRYLQGQGTH
ncbi:MAG: acetylxylan esterase [Chloroflexi bacterium]|nr:acetylxylan esterase [Chloroflexota bacterium]